MHRNRFVDDELAEWSPEVPSILKVLEGEGLRLAVRGRRLIVSGLRATLRKTLRNPHLKRVLWERRFDLAAWLRGDPSLGIRRLEDTDQVMWLVREPKAPRQRVALL